jgi:hypothetical protein
VNRGSIWECELCPFDFSPAADTSVAPNDRVLMAVLTGRSPEARGYIERTLAGGSLAERVPKITVRVAVSA